MTLDRNGYAMRMIAEILAAEGEELPKKWQEQLLKPSRRRWKFPEEPAEQSEARFQNEPETAGTAPMAADVTPAPAPEECRGRNELRRFLCGPATRRSFPGRVHRS